MDPIVIVVIVVLAIMLALRIFFGLAKFVFRIAALIVIAVIIWRVFFLKS
jgi:hypothetical protein